MIEHDVAFMPVPFGQCPRCSRTLVPVGIFVSADSIIWHMKCPLHNDEDYAMSP